MSTTYVIRVAGTREYLANWSDEFGVILTDSLSDAMEFTSEEIVPAYVRSLDHINAVVESVEVACLDLSPIVFSDL